MSSIVGTFVRLPAVTFMNKPQKKIMKMHKQGNQKMFLYECLNKMKITKFMYHYEILMNHYDFIYQIAILITFDKGNCIK